MLSTLSEVFTLHHSRRRSVRSCVITVQIPAQSQALFIYAFSLLCLTCQARFKAFWAVLQCVETGKAHSHAVILHARTRILKLRMKQHKACVLFCFKPHRFEHVTDNILFKLSDLVDLWMQHSGERKWFDEAHVCSFGNNESEINTVTLLQPQDLKKQTEKLLKSGMQPHCYLLTHSLPHFHLFFWREENKFSFEF